jgi:hypothetical protein
LAATIDAHDSHTRYPGKNPATTLDEKTQKSFTSTK